jgi:hypothetical protein
MELSVIKNHKMLFLPHDDMTSQAGSPALRGFRFSATLHDMRVDVRTPGVLAWNHMAFYSGLP